MTTIFGVRELGALIRRRGLPARPVTEVQVSEIRSDQFLNPLATLEPPYTSVALAPLVTEWRFTVPYSGMTEFHRFLAANDPFIAEGCGKVMSGVRYCGTYLGAVGQRNVYRTVWGYESWDAQREWTKVVEDPASRLYAAVRTLRSYWTADPHSSQEHFAYAAQVNPADHPFLELTIRAAES
jgi:hypothetical protein